MQFRLLFVLLLSSSCLMAQLSTVSGTVRDRATQELLVGATVLLEGSTGAGAITDIDGNFKLTNVPPKTYNIEVRYVGYETILRNNVVVTSGNDQYLMFELEEARNEIGPVIITVNRNNYVANAETPLSIQGLNIDEIKSNPGGNFDISRTLQVLPGVGGGTSSGARNDLIIRGGGPSENVFYLDGVEIPVLNHFQTQGAAGGPAGILNVSFIQDAVLSSSAFNARYDNPLSGVLQFNQRVGSRERLQGNFRVSGSETALTLEGPAGPKASFLASARRSYLQFLFAAIGLPIRPDYWDFQYKVTRKINDKTTLNVIGLGAIDKFFFAVPEEATPENIFIVGSAPIINQWNYTQGFSLRTLIDNGYYNVVFSRNMFNNTLDQFSDNYDGQQKDEAKRRLKLKSQEIENKLRFDYNKYYGQWKVAYGAGLQYVKYNNSTFAVVAPEIRDTTGAIVQPGVTFNYNTDIDFFKYGAFAQVNRNLMHDRLTLSGGVRFDGNTFTNTGNEIWRTLSPRVSASYAIASRWKVNGSVGRYFKIAPYTVLGFRNENGFVNQDAAYIRADHAVVGVEYISKRSSRFTVEGFYKQYADYPISVQSGISLANLGNNFGTVGNEPITSDGKGRAYGFEAFYQQKLFKNMFYTVSYTYFHSEFSGADGKYVRSAWDNRHLLSSVFGYKLPRNWELGLKYRFQGNAPFTPIDTVASRLSYATTGDGVLDFARLNSQELLAFNQLDIRIDKKWNFKKYSLDLFLDIQNLLTQQTQGYPNYTFQRLADNSGWDTTDGQALQTDGSNAKPLILDNFSGNLLPTIGIIVEF